MMAAAVKPDMEVPPLSTLRPGKSAGQCKNGLSVKEVNDFKNVLSTVPALLFLYSTLLKRMDFQLVFEGNL